MPLELTVEFGKLAASIEKHRTEWRVGQKLPWGDVVTDEMMKNNIRGNCLLSYRWAVEDGKITHEDAKRIYEEYIRLTDDTEYTFEEMMHDKKSGEEKRDISLK